LFPLVSSPGVLDKLTFPASLAGNVVTANHDPLGSVRSTRLVEMAF
jgi:hypothetical protein